MKKIKIIAEIEEDNIGFTLQKSRDINLVEIVGLLNVITDEVKQTLKDKMKISKE